MEPMQVKHIPNISTFKRVSFRQVTDKMLLMIIIMALLLARSIWLPKANAAVYTHPLKSIEKSPSYHMGFKNVLRFDSANASLLCAIFINTYDDPVKKALIIIRISGTICGILLFKSLWISNSSFDWPKTF